MPTSNKPPETDEEMLDAASRFEDWADRLDARDFENIADLRAVAEAADAVQAAQARLREAVETARFLNDRSWTQIGLALGVSRQAARERFGRQRVRAVE